VFLTFAGAHFKQAPLLTYKNNNIRANFVCVITKRSLLPYLRQVNQQASVLTNKVNKPHMLYDPMLAIVKIVLLF